jgi:hypothetical protein
MPGAETSRNDHDGYPGFYQGNFDECIGVHGNYTETRWVPGASNCMSPLADERAPVNLGNTPKRRGAIIHGAKGKRLLADFRDGTSNSIIAAEKSLPLDRLGSDGGDNERWQNAGWDEDNIRCHFVPIPDSRAPSRNRQCRTPSEPTQGSTL